VALLPDGSLLEGKQKPFTICGPTCDSVDMLPVQVELPDTVDEGDYVIFGWMGAYSNALLTTFNGLGALDYATVDTLSV
jgi:ornithine decarboxylase